MTLAIATDIGAVWSVCLSITSALAICRVRCCLLLDYTHFVHFSKWMYIKWKGTDLDFGSAAKFCIAYVFQRKRCVCNLVLSFDQSQVVFWEGNTTEEWFLEFSLGLCLWISRNSYCCCDIYIASITSCSVWMATSEFTNSSSSRHHHDDRLPATSNRLAIYALLFPPATCRLYQIVNHWISYSRLTGLWSWV